MPSVQGGSHLEGEAIYLSEQYSMMGSRVVSYRHCTHSVCYKFQKFEPFAEALDAVGQITHHQHVVDAGPMLGLDV